MTPPPDRERVLKHSREVVLSKVKHMFPQLAVEEVMQVLDRYGAAEHGPGLERVQLAILKLSEGSFENLEYYVAVAKSDYRDVLSWAEYPLYSCYGFERIASMTPEELKVVEDKDFQQYLAWLEEGQPNQQSNAGG